MTFEQALTALKQGKKVTRREFRNEAYLTDYVSYSAEEGIDKLKIKYKNGQTALTDKPPATIDIFSDDWEIAEDEAKPPIESVSTKDLIAELRKRNNVIIKEVLPNTASTFVVNGYDGGKIVFIITEKPDN